MRRETYMGRKLSVRIDRRAGHTRSYINGVLLGLVYGTSETVIDREIRSLRSWVDAADERRSVDPTAFPPHFYIGAPEETA